MKGGAAAAASGVRHGDVLTAFAEALVVGDDAQLAAAGRRVRERLGDTGWVDAAAVAANFQRMVRIADATGIPLDPPMELVTQGLRSELGLGAFTSSANTPPGGAVWRWLGRGLQPLAPVVLRAYARWKAPRRRPKPGGRAGQDRPL